MENMKTINEMASIKEFEKLVGDKCYCRFFANMSQIEKRYIESILDETIMTKGITLSDHCLKRSKQRNLSIGRLQIGVRQGTIREVQFDKYGCKIVISYASEAQRDKGYLIYIVYSLSDGKIVSCFNKQRKAEKKINPETKIDGNKEYMLKENCLTLLHKFLNMEPTVEEFVKLLRKYDCSNFCAQDEKKLKEFRLGRKPLQKL